MPYYQVPPRRLHAGRTVHDGNATTHVVERACRESKLAQKVGHAPACDIDDLIMNTLGACAGYVIQQAGTRIARWTAQRQNACSDKTGACCRNAEGTNTGAERPHAATVAGVAAAVSLGRFFLFDKTGAASMIYGF